MYHWRHFDRLGTSPENHENAFHEIPTSVTTIVTG